MTPQQPSKTKTYGTIVIVILIFLLIYFYTSGSTPTAGNLTAGSTFGTVGSSELGLLNQVKSLTIDTALFNDAAFRSLKDYSVAITPEIVGRPNPFAPLPGEAVRSAASQTQNAGGSSSAVPTKSR
ncbi:MAG TPA: hypothetical protein VF438_01720 [Candidatus Paceibacterota bacterium]